jgi:hypothetical protein
MNELINPNSAFAPIGAIIAGLVALAVVGGAATYQYSKTADGSGSQKDASQSMQRKGFGLAANMQHDKNFKANYQQELNTYPLEDISKEEKEDLIYMREEEKLARDVYRTLYEKWGEQIFDNISYSEERHTLAIRALLERYSIEDPVLNDDVGVFQNTNLTNLYNDLVDKGSTSLVDALKVGATIEDLDIKDLQDAIDRTDNEDIRHVYENLMRGSRNHLRAFYSTLQGQTSNYTAQYITQLELEEIVSGSIERGAGHGQGGQSKRQSQQGQESYRNSAGHKYGNGERQGHGAGGACRGGACK